MQFVRASSKWPSRVATLVAAVVAGCVLFSSAESQAQVRAAGERHFIEFRARPSTYIGHTFIHYGRLDPSGRIIDSQRVGLIPEEDAWKGLVFPVRGTVREYKDDTRLPSLVIYRRHLTPAEYARVVAAVRHMQASEHLWHGVFFNCNDFAIAIAQVLGLNHAPSLMPPDAWVGSLGMLN